MPIPDAYRAISLLEFNVGAAAAVAFLNPLCAQLDALLVGAIGPFKLGLAAQFNAALSLQVSLSLAGPQNLLVLLAQALAALVQLQASLAIAMSLGIPPISFSLNVEISGAAALAASLKVQLGALEILIKLALAVKIPALRAAAGLTAALNLGPFFAISFSGVPLQSVSSWLSAQVASGGLNADGEQILPTDPVFGVLIFGGNPSVQAGFGAIISVPS